MRPQLSAGSKKRLILGLGTLVCTVFASVGVRAEAGAALTQVPHWASSDDEELWEELLRIWLEFLRQWARCNLGEATSSAAMVGDTNECFSNGGVALFAPGKEPPEYAGVVQALYDLTWSAPSSVSFSAVTELRINLLAAGAHPGVSQ